MSPASRVHLVLPDAVDDPQRPSGGNTYDRRLCDGLTADGWIVREHPVPADGERLDEVLAAVPDGSLVLVDGLVASQRPEVMVPQARRLRLVVLLHMPVGAVDAEGNLDRAAARERAVLCAAEAVVVTSGWTRAHLVRRYGLPEARVHVAAPGVDRVGTGHLAPGTAAGDQLLCVAAMTLVKGQDLLVDALSRLTDLPWRCLCVGSLERQPGFVARLTARIQDAGLEDRVRLVGPRPPADVAATYRVADLLVAPSRSETYGMVVADALAHGLPVVATAVGGLPEAVGEGAGGVPGLLVPPEDPGALAGALRHWLTDPRLRARLRQAARERRETLTGWDVTAGRVATVLGGLVP